MVSIKTFMQSKGEIIQESVAENKIEFGWKIRKILQKMQAVLLIHVI